MAQTTTSKTSTTSTTSTDSTNLVVLTGVLSSTPVARVLPSGDHLIHYEVTSGANGEDRPTTTVPVVRFQAEPPKTLGAEGDVVAVLGFVRRRFYRAGGATQSRTEVVASRLHLRPTKRQSTALAKRAMSMVGGPA